MCTNPGLLADGTEIACRICWQCRDNKVNDWVGRCVAETKTAVNSLAFTLTYGRDENDDTDHFRSAWLTYSDVQKYFKYLRSDGYKFRYLVAGEYGSEKGRAHWHALMFFEGDAPPHELTIDKKLTRRFHNKYWPHGHQVCTKVHEASARYVCKYINKDVGKEERQAHLAMSKKPPLGDAYFRLLAQKYVDAGLSPQDLFYTFPEIKDNKTGLPKKFFLRDTTAHNFIEYYKAAWERMYGNKHHPYSEVIEKHDDKIAAQNDNIVRTEPKISIPDLPIGAKRLREGVNPVTGFKGIYTDDMWSVRYWLRRSDEGELLWRSEEEMSEERANEWSTWREARGGSTEQSEAERSEELIRWIRSALRGLSGSP